MTTPADPRAVPIEQLACSEYAYRVLHVHLDQVETLGDLCALTVGDIWRTRGVGIVTLCDIIMALEKHGLALQPDKDIEDFLRRKYGIPITGASAGNLRP